MINILYILNQDVNFIIELIIILEYLINLNYPISLITLLVLLHLEEHNCLMIKFIPDNSKLYQSITHKLVSISKVD